MIKRLNKNRWQIGNGPMLEALPNDQMPPEGAFILSDVLEVIQNPPTCEHGNPFDQLGESGHSIFVKKCGCSLLLREAIAQKKGTGR